MCIHVHVAYSPMSILQGMLNLYPCRRVYSPVSMLQGILTCIHVAGYTHLYPCRRVYSPVSMLPGILTFIHAAGYTHLYPCCRVYSTYLYTAAAREKLKDPSTQKLHEQVVRAVNAYKECFKKYPVRVCVYNRTLTRLHPVSALTFLPCFLLLPLLPCCCPCFETAAYEPSRALSPGSEAVFKVPRN